MKKVIDFLKSNLCSGDILVVACSGGADSMCLLDIITTLKDELNLKVIVAHVNHKLRLESEQEALMVENYSKKHGLEFELLEINEYLTENFTEEDARKRRYKFFEEVVKKYNASFLLTAHHGDDLIETILMRLTRGSNLSGYIGIKEVSTCDNYKILRPLLSVNKDDILKYNRDNNVTFSEDKTNKELIHTRNRYRHVVLPFLKKENPKVNEKYLKFSKELIEYDNFVNTYIVNNKFIVDNFIDINKVLSESDFVKRKCLELLVKDIQSKDYFDISDSQMDNLVKLLNQSNKSIDLNNNYMGVNSYGKVYIVKKENNTLEEVILDKTTLVGNFIFTYNEGDADSSNSCICLLSSEIKLPLKLRSVKTGDKIHVKNLNGSKKVSDIFIDCKVPKDKRSAYPVLVDAKNNILWVPNLKKSQFSKDISQKYDIIIRCKAR